MMLPEDKILKKYIDSRRKEYLELARNTKQNDAAIELKQTVTRVTIEGEHTYLFVIKRIVDFLEQKQDMFEVELLPILNAPH